MQFRALFLTKHISAVCCSLTGSTKYSKAKLISVCMWHAVDFAKQIVNKTLHAWVGCVFLLSSWVASWGAIFPQLKRRMNENAMSKCSHLIWNVWLIACISHGENMQICWWLIQIIRILMRAKGEQRWRKELQSIPLKNDPVHSCDNNEKSTYVSHIINGFFFRGISPLRPMYVASRAISSAFPSNYDIRFARSHAAACKLWLELTQFYCCRVNRLFRSMFVMIQYKNDMKWSGMKLATNQL